MLTLVLARCIPDGDIVELLKIMPSVEDLTLKGPLSAGKRTVTNQFFQTLRHQRSASSSKAANQVLPKLKSLSYTGPMHFTWPVFLEMFPPPTRCRSCGCETTPPGVSQINKMQEWLLASFPTSIRFNNPKSS